jgi:hypothetical protein
MASSSYLRSSSYYILGAVLLSVYMMMIFNFEPATGANVCGDIKVNGK